MWRPSTAAETWIRAGQEGELGDRVVEMSLSRSEPGHLVGVAQAVAGDDDSVGGVNAEHELQVVKLRCRIPRTSEL